MIPLVTYCHTCDHEYTMTDQYKDCPYCDKKKLRIRTMLVWICFGIGHMFSLVLNIIPDSFPDWMGTMFYRPYSKFMLWSCDLDIHGALWTDCNEEGIVHNIDTTGFTEGEKIYLSETVAGGLATKKPDES